MPARWKRDDGLAALELGMLLPVLLLLLSVVIPVVQAGWGYMVVSRAQAHGIRYATRADTNPRMSSGGYLTRRPTVDEVSAFVRQAASPLDLASVEVSPEPAASLPGEVITVRSTYVASFGPVAELANGVKTLFLGGGTFLPESRTVTVTTRGREE